MIMLDKNFLLINKPAGWTSFDVVAYVRKKVSNRYTDNYGATDRTDTNPLLRTKSVDPLNTRIKVGHAGTLDPFATGLLIVGVGREATKRLDEFKNLPKTYVATLRLGAVSDTYDRTGTISHSPYPITHNPNDLTINSGTGYVIRDMGLPSERQILDVLKTFEGKQNQIPPMFSAKSIGGVRLYKLARQGKVIERTPNEIEILDIKILKYFYPLLKIEVECSAGTYIRSLANDIGEKLGTGAYCEELERTRIGEFKLEDAKAPQEI